MSASRRQHRTSPKVARRQAEARPDLRLVTAENKAEHVRQEQERRIGRLASSDRAPTPRWRKIATWVGIGLATLVVANRVYENSQDSSEQDTVLLARPYTVKPGDTPISIARDLAPDEDPRPIADSITQQDSDLQPGDTVMAPGLDHIVRPGDTAWNIAEHLVGDGDPRPLSDAIVRANGGANLQIGHEIIIESDDLPKV